MVVRMPKVSQWPARGGLDSEFPSPRTPASDRQGLALGGRYICQAAWSAAAIYARQYAWSAAAYWLFAANLYMCIHIHSHVHIHAYTYIQIHRASCYPPPNDAPHCRCQLPAHGQVVGTDKVAGNWCRKLCIMISVKYVLFVGSFRNRRNWSSCRYFRISL